MFRSIVKIIFALVIIGCGTAKIEVRECGFPPDTKRQSVNVDANNTRLIVISC